MIFVLFALWILFNGRWTNEIAIIGVVVCGLLYAFMCAFMGYSPRKEWALARKLPAILRYLLYLVGEIFKSAWCTIRFIWSPKVVVQPQVTSFRTRLKTDAGKVVLGNSITMTPGTITVDVRGDEILVHCLDESLAEGLEDSEMERRILALEGDDHHE